MILDNDSCNNDNDNDIDIDNENDVNSNPQLRLMKRKLKSQTSVQFNIFNEILNRFICWPLSQSRFIRFMQCSHQN